MIFLFITDPPFIVLNPLIPAENTSAVFRCEGKYGGPPKEQMPKGYHPYLSMFYTHDPGIELPAIDTSINKNNTLIKVINCCELFQLIVG